MELMLGGNTTEMWLFLDDGVMNALFPSALYFQVFFSGLELLYKAKNPAYGIKDYSRLFLTALYSVY